MRHGFDLGYKTWVHHGEPDLPPPPPVIDNTRQPQMSDMTALLNDLSYIPPNNEHNEPTQGDIGETSNEPTQATRNEFEELYASANEELYPGCDYVTRLDFMAKFTYFKVKGKLTDSIFNEMLEFFQNVFPISKGYKLPPSYYAIKKTFKTIGLGYESIHACEHDCCLFRGDNNKDLDFCPVCNTSRWKDSNTPGKKVPKKVLRYFPIIPRLQRLYKSRHTAKDMIWHATGKCTEPGKMQHPVDGGAWKKFDMKYPDFAKEPRNVRLGLCADGFNPFGNLSQTYSMWPVILTTYNLPPWLCMKESNFMLTLLIPGPKSPGKDIDVYLRPLIEDLQVLWDKKGVETTDIVSGQNFNMRAMVLWTINDFPARSSLSGWSGQGYKACPTCNEETPSIGVKNKIAYVGHRRFLRKPHKWRSSREFNGDTDHRDPPKEYPRDVILAQHARLLTRVPGKHPKHGGVKIKRNVEVELNWTKRSIFYELEYWSFISLRHNLDIMHIEKNVLEAILNTLLMNDKSKDTAKARQDLQKLGIRRTFVDKGLKVSDCHIMMQRLLPYGLQNYLPDNIAKPIIELSSLFKQLCSATLMEDDMLKASVQALKAGLFTPVDVSFVRFMKKLKDLVAVTRQKPISKTPRGLANITSELFALANGPSRTPMSVNACVVDGVRYVVQSRDERRTTQNSGICAPGPDGEMSYGQLQEILEFKYLSFKVALFRVKWFDTRNNGRADSDVEDSSIMMMVLRKFILVKKKINLVLWMMLLRAHGGDGGGEDLHVHLPYIILGKKKKEAKAQFGRVKSRRQEDPGKDPEPRIKGLRSTYNLEPHIRSERWPRIEGYIQAQFGKSYNTNKATLKREHWIRTPELELMIWIGSGGANRMESRHDENDVATKEEKRGTFRDRLRFLIVYTTVNGVFQDLEPPDVSPPRRNQRDGPEAGKLHGHIPGVGPVMPGYVRSRLSYTAPVDRSRDVDFMMSLMRSDNRFADAFARYDSGGASGSGGSRARDSEGGEDGDDTGGEDGGDDTS
ncbi:hypothetical protein Tco_0153714 [Tanacetum coccineum]